MARTRKITSFFALRKRKLDDKRQENFEVLEKKMRSDIHVGTVPSTSATSTSGGSRPMGVFDAELFGQFFEYFVEHASLKSLIAVSQASVECAMRILRILKNGICASRLSRTVTNIRPCDEYTERDTYFMLGKLLKSSTSMAPTGQRIAYLKSLFETCENHDLRGWGRLVHTMCRKWKFSECEALVSFLVEIGEDVMKKLDKIVASECGEFAAEEMEVRKYLLEVVMSRKFDKDEETYWLATLLNKMVEHRIQSRIIGIMYAPTKRENGKELIDWQMLYQRNVRTLKQGEQKMRKMADALMVLVKAPSLNVLGLSWSNQAVFNIIEELTTCPESWSQDNFAVIFLLQPDLIPISIGCRMRHGYDDEAGQMINAMKTLMHRWKMSMDTVSDALVRTVLSLTRRQACQLICRIKEAHASALNDRMMDMKEELLSMSYFDPLLVKMFAAAACV